MVKKAKKASAKKSVVRVDALESRARDIAKGEVEQLTFDPLEAKRSCREGLSKFEANAAALKKLCPAFDFAGVRALPELCDRITAAQRQVDQARAGEPLTNVQLQAATAWRRRLLPLAQTLAEQQEVSAAKVRQIIIGHGITDSLQDIIDLAALLEPLQAKVEEVLGQGSLAAASAAASRALGSLGVLKGDPAAVVEAADRRDRYATLVVQLHDLMRVGVALTSSYREAGVAVPSLSAGNGSGGRKKAPATPASPP